MYVCQRALSQFWGCSRQDNEMASLHVSRDYEMFDPWAYLDYQYGEVNGFHHHSLKHIHEFYKSCWSPSADLKVLEFGAGPVIAYVIRASLYTSEIVLSEYMETNRKCFRCGWIVIPMLQTGVPFLSDIARCHPLYWILHGAILSTEFAVKKWVQYHLTSESHFLRYNVGDPGNMHIVQLL